jgi:ferric-dicitrate binding protein FerR (iron transport regulator)
MDENRFYILIAKKLANELTDEEIIGKPPVTLHNQDKILSNLRLKLTDIDAGFKISEAENVAEEIKIEPAFWSIYRKKIILSSLAIFLIVSTLFILKANKQPENINAVSENNISTKPGSKSQVKLPDGTLVILNADSKLTYPDNFLGNTREVTLEGEAYFNVTHNKQKPFIIHSKAMDIKVLGTQFNVKAYPQENTSEATLIKGSIEVTLTGHTHEKIMLKPNEKITVSNQPVIQNVVTEKPQKIPSKPIDEIPLISVDQVRADEKENIISEIGWTQNKLMFKNESLQSIVATLGRWYGVQIQINSENLKDQKFTGNFNAETLTQVLQALQLSYNFSYKKENNSIIIY